MTFPLESWSALVLAVEAAGLATAVHALMTVRSDRGTIAWCIGLVAMPFIALPLYAVFGRAKFERYRRAIAEVFEDQRAKSKDLEGSIKPFAIEDSPLQRVLARLSPYAFTRGNRLQLLIDGEATFKAIFDAIEKAQAYVFIEFYIVRDDTIGNQLKDLLVRRAGEGVRVCFLYDEIGSKDLSAHYVRSLQEAGIQTAPFAPPLRRCDFFHLNFRNHRKIVIVDGETAFVGGHNIGDEYLGKDPAIGAWRDTHVRVQGPAVVDCQRTFLESWYWATRELPAVRPWEAASGDVEGGEALVLPTGPVLHADVCTLAFKAMINEARQRCWIASPYFVPNETLVDTLRYAALRGVDVRILLPSRPDHWIVHLASCSYIELLQHDQIQFFRYEAGFLHQKVILIDDNFAGVSTMNLDQRSFHLNFEVGVFAHDATLVAQVEAMLERDFAQSRLVKREAYQDRAFPFRVAMQAARLFSPVL